MLSTGQVSRGGGRAGRSESRQNEESGRKTQKQVTALHSSKGPADIAGRWGCTRRPHDPCHGKDPGSTQRGEVETGVVIVSEEQRTVPGSREQTCSGWLEDKNRGLRESSGGSRLPLVARPAPGTHLRGPRRAAGAWQICLRRDSREGRRVIRLPAAANRSSHLEPLAFLWTGWLPQGVRTKGFPPVPA